MKSLPPAAPARPTAASRGKVKVLVVDDNPAQRLSMRVLLADLGVTVIEAASGRDALRHVLRDEFALILLDVNMPGMDGFETAEMIRARSVSEHTPIIFVTAYGEDAARGYSLRAVDYILAPVQREVLRTKVSVLIDLYRKTDQIKWQREALRRYAAQLQQLSEASLAINSATTADEVLRTMVERAGRIIGAHRAAATAAASDVTPLSAEYVSEIPAPADEAPDAADALDLASEDPGATSDWEGPQLPEPGDVIPFRDQLTAPLRGRNGRSLGAARIMEKLEGEFTAEDEGILVQLAQMASIAIENILATEAREANRLKDEFLGVLSHELRTPLQAMLSWVSILRQDSSDPERLTRGLDVIDRSARMQGQLINDLLDVSRIIRGQMSLETSPVSLVQVVDLAIETLKPAAAARSVQIAFEVPKEESRVIGDEARLQQVIWNLVSNAIKFSPAGGTVTIALNPMEEEVRLEVRDTGQGIPPAFLPHVFERFRQADSSPGRRHGGLGLGLAIVKNLVALHGGSVSAENAPEGTGAVFTITIPRRPAEQDAQEAGAGVETPAGEERPLLSSSEDVPESPSISAAGANAPAPGRSNEALPAQAADRKDALVAAEVAARVSQPGSRLDGIRVILVEDHDEARDCLASALELYGAEVISVDSAEAALAILESSQPHVLLSDIGIPGMDGYTFIRRVRAREAERGGRIPAAALTAYVRPEDRSAALQAGFDTHVHKPIEPIELAKVVKRLFEQTS